MLINTRMPSQATGYSYHFFVLKLYVTLICYKKKWWKNVNLHIFEWNGTEVSAGKSFNSFDGGSVVMINIPEHGGGLCAAKLKNVDGKYVQFFANGGYAIKYWKNGYEQYSSYQSSTEKIA